MAKHFIKEMHLKKGALHKDLHVPLGQKIPEKKLKSAENKGGIVGKRAHLAETLKGMNHSNNRGQGGRG
jgi:hypothetical protein